MQWPVQWHMPLHCEIGFSCSLISHGCHRGAGLACGFIAPFFSSKGPSNSEAVREATAGIFRVAFGVRFGVDFYPLPRVLMGIRHAQLFVPLEAVKPNSVCKHKHDENFHCGQSLTCTLLCPRPRSLWALPKLGVAKDWALPKIVSSSFRRTWRPPHAR